MYKITWDRRNVDNVVWSKVDELGSNHILRILLGKKILIKEKTFIKGICIIQVSPTRSIEIIDLNYKEEKPSFETEIILL